jgi:DUF971 family protein
MTELTPVSLKMVQDALEITWSDGVKHRLTWKQLRDACPCATCRQMREQRAADAASREARTSPAPLVQPPPSAALLPVLSLAETRPLRVTSMKPVGNYAYDIDFSDGHRTGIYTLEHLRELGEAAQ